MDTKLKILIGCMCGMPGQTCLISKKNREALGLELGDVLLIESEEQSTSVSRRVLRAPNMPNKDEFVFLAPEDLDFLNLDISENVTISPDISGVERP